MFFFQSVSQQHFEIVDLWFLREIPIFAESRALKNRFITDAH